MNSADTATGCTSEASSDAAVLDAGRSRLHLDLGAVTLGLGDDLDRLPGVLGDVEVGSVERTEFQPALGSC